MKCIEDAKSFINFAIIVSFFHERYKLVTTLSLENKLLDTFCERSQKFKKSELTFPTPLGPQTTSGRKISVFSAFDVSDVLNNEGVSFVKKLSVLKLVALCGAFLTVLERLSIEHALWSCEKLMAAKVLLAIVTTTIVLESFTIFKENDKTSNMFWSEVTNAPTFRRIGSKIAHLQTTVHHVRNLLCL